MSRDVVGVATSLGASRILVAGHGIGGTIAWAIPQIIPAMTGGIMPVSAPHPLQVRTSMPAFITLAAAKYAFFQTPFLAARGLRSGRMVRSLLKSWSAKPNRSLMLAEADRYQAVLKPPFAAECALRPLRELRTLSAAERKMLRPRVTCPVLAVRGNADPVLPAQAYAHDADHTSAPLGQVVLPHTGHFVPEESPDLLIRSLSQFAQTVLHVDGLIKG